MPGPNYETVLADRVRHLRSRSLCSGQCRPTAISKNFGGKILTVGSYMFSHIHIDRPFADCTFRSYLTRSSSMQAPVYRLDELEEENDDEWKISSPRCCWGSRKG